MWGGGVWGSTCWGGDSVSTTVAAADYFLEVARISGVDFVFYQKIKSESRINFELLCRRAEVVAADFSLKYAYIGIHHVDFLLYIDRPRYHVTKSDFSLLSRVENAIDSLVIDSHNPKSPILGRYE